MTALASGQMDRQIVLQTPVKSQDQDTGEELMDWTETVIWAQWLPAGTSESYHAQQRLQSTVDGVFRIWDRSPRPVPDGTRILFDGKIFDVKPYVEIGRGQALEIPVVAHGE